MTDNIRFQVSRLGSKGTVRARLDDCVPNNGVNFPEFFVVYVEYS